MTITERAPEQATEGGTDSAPDQKVVVCLTHGADEPENVLISYLLGVEALRAGKEAVFFLTKDGVNVAIEGFAETVDVPGAPSIADLHREFAERGGTMYVCPVCVKVRGLEDVTWLGNAEVKGAPSVYEFAAGGALVFNY